MQQQGLDIEIRRSFFFPKKRLIINETAISHGDKTMLCSSIKAIRFGSIQIYVNGIKGNKVYEFGFLDNQNQVLKFSFVSSKIIVKDSNKEDQYKQIIDAVWSSISSKMLNKWLEELSQGKSIRVGKAEVSQSGVKFKGRKFFIPKEVFVPWKDLRKRSAAGFLIMFPAYDKWLKYKMRYIKDWNCIMLHYLLNYLWEDGRAYSLAGSSRDASMV